MAKTAFNADPLTGPALTAHYRHARLPVPGEGNKKSGMSLLLPLLLPSFSPSWADRRE